MEKLTEYPIVASEIIDTRDFATKDMENALVYDELFDSVKKISCPTIYVWNTAVDIYTEWLNSIKTKYPNAMLVSSNAICLADYFTNSRFWIDQSIPVMDLTVTATVNDSYVNSLGIVVSLSGKKIEINCNNYEP